MSMKAFSFAASVALVITSNAARSDENCTMGSKSVSEGSTCVCPPGTSKVAAPAERDDFPNGAKLCRFNMPINRDNCTWEYVCKQLTRPPAQTGQPLPPTVKEIDRVLRIMPQGQPSGMPAQKPPVQTPPARVAVPTSGAAQPYQSASAYVGCGSTITGLGGSPSTSQTSGSSCIKNAGWSASQPYNHGKTPIVFKPFYGQPVTINLGETLWSVLDDTAPGGRKLESRPWNNTSDPGGCRQQDTQTSEKDFRAGLACESERQKQLEEGFQHREDSYPYMDWDQCKGEIEALPNWQTRSLDFWKSHSTLPVAWCKTNANGTPMDPIRRLRQKNLGTEQECKNTPRALKIVVNQRGVLGCNLGDTFVPGSFGPGLR